MQFIDEKQRKKDCLKYDKLFEKQHEKYLKNEQKLKKPRHTYVIIVFISLFDHIQKIPNPSSFNTKLAFLIF